MRSIRIAATALLVALVTASAIAQTPPARPTAPPPSVVPAPARPVTPATPAIPGTPPPEATSDRQFDGFETRRYVRPVFRLGTPYALAQGTEAAGVVVVMGDVQIDGRVEGDVVVVLGSLRLGATASVRDSVVVVGGTAAVASGASVGRDFVVVAGGVDAPPGFLPMGEHVVIGPPGLGAGLRSVAPWFTRGLLWGRVVVPSLPWMWGLIGIVLLLNLALVLAFPKAIHACVETLGARPLSAFLAGLFTLLLVGPVTTVLAISVVGIIVIPFVFCALVVAWMLGKVAVAQWVGGGLVRWDDSDSRFQALRSLAIGFALILVAYMVPVIGLATWAIVGVFGLGAATLTAAKTLKRERPAPPPRPVSSAAPDVPVTPAAALSAVPFSPSPSFDGMESTPGAAGAPVVSPAGGGVSGADLSTYPRATFLDRLGACVLDVLLVVIARRLLDWDHDDGMLFVLFLVYSIAFLAWKGTTIGGIVCSLRVVRLDGSPLRPVDAVVRTLSSLFSIAALGIGFFWILIDGNRDKQAWHDKIAGTLVVRVPRDLAL